MTTASFTAWAQRSLLGTANPAIDDVLAWTLPHASPSWTCQADARASHHARTAMRSIGAGMSCLDDVLLATSELTANALQHGGGTPRLTAVRSRATASPWRSPTTVRMSCPSSCRYVARWPRPVGAWRSSTAISSHWGVTVYHDHKVVWCELAGHP